MPKLRLQNIIQLSQEILILAIIFLIPLYFSYFLSGSSIFELAKISLFKILVLLLFLATAVRGLFFANKLEVLILIKNKYLIIPGFLILTLIISTLLAPNFSFSFYGLYNRQQGLVSYFFYFLFFLLLLFNISNFSSIRRMSGVAFISSFLVSVYGLAQIFGYDFVNWSEPSLLTGRATSTLGQPNFLAAYLILVIPWGVFWWQRTKNFYLRFFILLAWLAQLLALYFTYSRGAWLGTLGGLLIISIFYLRQQRINFKKYFFQLLGAGLLLLVLGSALLFHNNMFLQRIKSSFNLKSGSVAARILFWKASWQPIKEKIFFGYGLDSQGEVFAKLYRRDWAVYGDVNAYPNRAHNLIIDTLLSSGLFGLIAYLLLYGQFFYLLVLAWRYFSIQNNKELNIFIGALLFALSAYLIFLLFNFAIVVTNIYFWLYFAWIILIAQWLANSPKKLKE